MKNPPPISPSIAEGIHLQPNAQVRGYLEVLARNGFYGTTIEQVAERMLCAGIRLVATQPALVPGLLEAIRANTEQEPKRRPRE